MQRREAGGGGGGQWWGTNPLSGLCKTAVPISWGGFKAVGPLGGPSRPAETCLNQGEASVEPSRKT